MPYKKDAFYRICKSKRHEGDRICRPEQFSGQDTICMECRNWANREATKRRQERKAHLDEWLRRHLLRRARDKLIYKTALEAPGLPMATIEALAVFGGLKGFIAAYKAEFDKAEPGSQVRRQILSDLTKIMTTNALSGGVEDIEKLSDEELEEEAQEVVKQLRDEPGDDELMDDLDDEEFTDDAGPSQ